MFRKVLGGAPALNKAVENDTRECEESASLPIRSGQCYANTKELSRSSGNVARLLFCELTEQLDLQSASIGHDGVSRFDGRKAILSNHSTV